MIGLAVALLGLMSLISLNTPIPQLENLAGKLGQSAIYAKLYQPHHNAAVPFKQSQDSFTPQAKSVLAIDLVTGETLTAHNPDEQLPIASITKLVTVMVVLREHELSEIVTIPDLPAYDAADSRLGLVAGQRFSLSELLEAALIPSANDAADALAIWDSGTTQAFSVKMNDLVRAWGITGPHFSTASGLIDTNNHASARDLAKIAKIALANSQIRTLAASPQAQVSDLDGRSYAVTTTNRLLGTHGVKGLKTGYTLAAGQSFMSLASISNHDIITVVLNSPDRFAETNRLLDWIERNWQWQ